ncbi:MAG TPA: hypothetical protein VGL10_05620 [Gammaproteobacteria bacterium]
MPNFFSAGTQTIHKLCMLGGIIAIGGTLYLSWVTLDRIEPQTAEVLRLQILTELDLQSFQQQLESLEQSINAGKQPGAGEYSPQQIELLAGDMRVLQNEILTTARKLDQLNAQRAQLAGNIKLTFIVSLLVLSASIVLTIFGFIGWNYQIRVLQEPD